jgi:hypothetical protein
MHAHHLAKQSYRVLLGQLLNQGVPYPDSLAKYAAVGSTGHSNSSDLMALLRRCNAKNWKTRDVCAAEKRVVEQVEGWAVSI